jgi:hypothetical protein
MRRSLQRWGGARLGPAEGHYWEPIGHLTGTTEGSGFLMVTPALENTRLELGFLVGAGEGAGEGNRTLMTSLEGRSP